MTMALKMSEFRGVWTALVTPFLSDDGIDWESFDRLCQIQNEADVDGVVISGTTGEAPTLEADEKMALVTRARKNLSRKIRLMMGSGTSSTKQSIELSMRAVSAGADSLLVVTPPYNKPNFEGLKNHYSSIAEKASVPICLYHVPGRTNQLLSAKQMAEIAEIKGVTGIKEASADLILFSKTVQLCHKNVQILSGDDFTYLPSLALGGAGIISVVTNVFPKAFVKMTRFYHSGKLADALCIHNILFPFVEALFCETNPTPAKAALEILGICSSGKLRAPLAPITREHFAKVKELAISTKNQLTSLGC